MEGVGLDKHVAILFEVSFPFSAMTNDSLQVGLRLQAVDGCQGANCGGIVGCGSAITFWRDAIGQPPQDLVLHPYFSFPRSKDDPPLLFTSQYLSQVTSY